MLTMLSDFSMARRNVIYMTFPFLWFEEKKEYDSNRNESESVMHINSMFKIAQFVNFDSTVYHIC